MKKKITEENRRMERRMKRRMNRRMKRRMKRWLLNVVDIVSLKISDTNNIVLYGISLEM